MNDSKPEESSYLDIHEEYLHLKAVSDKKLQDFARKPDDKKKLIDVSVEAKERAGAVLRKIHSAVVLSKLDVLDSNFRMLLSDSESYGRIVVRNDDPDNREGYKEDGKVFFGGAYNISEGLGIMEAQQGLLEFLICYCREALSSMTRSAHSDITTPEFNPQVHLVEPSWPEIGMDRTFSNFYGAPQMQMPTDFSKLRSMFNVRHTLAMDHVWLLRINPGYFEKNIEGVLHQNDPQSRDVVRVIFKAFLALQKWECLRNLAAEAERLQKEYEKTPRDYLQAVVGPPKHYFVAVLKLFKVLTDFEDEAFDILKCGEDESEMTRQFCKCLGDTLKSDKVEINGIKHMGIMRALNNIMRKNRPMHVFDFMDDLEEVSIYESSDGKRISVKGRIFSAFLAHFLSDLGLLGIATYEVWKDWAAQIFAATKDQKDMNFEKSWQMEETAVAIDSILFMFKDRLRELGSLADNKFNYPIDAKRSEESTESLRKAEQALDEFWQYVDKIMLNNGFSEFLKVSSMNMAFWRTPKWQAPKITTHESRVTMPARVVSANNLSATPPEIFANDTQYVILHR
ncbi:hypothetical protein EYC80_009569 [Monilinia laxa]|uniref:Uncharacterized protein n=1 Tax=Monilinia laxa TaxID=61186 RepID=A0A5N6JY96_MONLA|nr:hypothetical protein EYC80_009569 [Monilinia laxa]